MRWFKKRGDAGKKPAQGEQPAASKDAAPATASDSGSPDPALLRKRQILDASNVEQAVAAINHLDPPLPERIDLYLARRDLSEAIWRDPSLADEAALTAVEHHSRGHNKVVNRAARSRLKQLRGARKTATSLQQRALELIDSANRINAGTELSHRDLTARALLEEQWQAISLQWHEVAADLSDAERTLKTLPALNAALPRADEPKPVEPDLEAQARARERETALAERAAKEAAAQAASKEAAESRLDESNERIKTLLNAVDTAEENDSPGQQRLQRRELRQELRSLRKRIDWPTDIPKPPGLTQLAAADERLAEQMRELDVACATERDRLESSIETLTQTLADGQTRAAGSLHGQIRRAHPEHYGLSKAALKNLNEASQTLRQFGAWQQFATSPKRQALCDAMEQAAEAPLAPKLQAERIKELRADWQALGPPREEADRQALKRFDAFAEAAFEPCRQYYAELAEAREQNAAARQEICSQLQTYLDNTDWRSADYDAAETILREARSSWRQFHPVPRKREAELSRSFEALQNTLYERLQSFWNGNAERKQALIDSAVKLSEDSDTPLPARIEQAKRLQADWKAIGRVPRKRDQALWQDFRSACDALFSARESENAAQQVQLDTARSAAQQLLSEFATTLADTRSEDAHADVLRTFRGTLRDALTDLPGPLRRDLSNQAEDLMSRYQSLLDQAGLAVIVNELTAYQRWDADYSSAPAQPPADAPEKLFTGANPSAPLSESLTRFAIAAEMAADLPSPASDQGLRMAMKVEQLQQSMTRDPGNHERSEIGQAKAWCALGVKPDDAQTQALRERFFSALQSTVRATP
ncbi:MAG: DUF349 domain-containing protein [Pseudomonadales bacterium]